jgi:hypothetical protein
MRLSIIIDDKTVYLDKIPMSNLDLSFIPVEVHALQWNDNYGFIEYASAITDGINSKPNNTDITELPEWAEIAMQKWNEAKLAKDLEEEYFASVRAALLASR